MIPSAIRSVYFALGIIWLAQSAGIAQEGVSNADPADPKSQYGRFSYHPDSLQVFYDYIHSQEMMKVEAGAELQQAIEAIPVELGAPIDLAQEASLRTWFYDFLVAHSVSGSDSLAAAFYLRGGNMYPDIVETIKKDLKSERPDLLKGDRPFDVFRAAYRFVVLEALERDYLFGNVSFFDSVFKVFEMQEGYDSYEAYAATQGMLPRGTTTLELLLRPEIEERLKAGEKMVFVDVLFIVEEPAEFTTFEIPGRTPSFFRLTWDSERAIWRPVEVFFSRGVPQAFLLSTM